MAPASPLGVGGGVGLSRREAVHRFTRVLRAATGDPGRPPCGAREHPPTTRTVARQPIVWNPQTMIGAANPPSANPIVCIDSARARRFSNQATVAAEMVRKPTRLMPIASSSIARRNWARLSITATAMKPAALTIAPARITGPPPSLDLSPLHRPDEGGLSARGPEDDREEGLRPAELISEFHGEIPEPLDPHHRLERPHDGVGADHFHPVYRRRVVVSVVGPPSGRSCPRGRRNTKPLSFLEVSARSAAPAVNEICGQLRDQLVGKPRSTDELAGSGQRVVIAWGWCRSAHLQGRTSPCR